MNTVSFVVLMGMGAKRWVSNLAIGPVDLWQANSHVF